MRQLWKANLVESTGEICWSDWGPENGLTRGDEVKVELDVESR